MSESVVKWSARGIRWHSLNRLGLTATGEFCQLPNAHQASGTTVTAEILLRRRIAESLQDLMDTLTGYAETLSYAL